MDQSHQRQTIDPYYKQGDVFQRDEQYYSQMLSGTRRITNQLAGSARESSLQRSRSNQGQSRVSPATVRQTESVMRGASRVNAASSNVLNYNANQFASGTAQSVYVSTNIANSAQYKQAQEANVQLRQELQMLVNGSNDFGNSQNAVKLLHYSLSKQETSIIRDQQSEIKRLQGIVRANQSKIAAFKKAGADLATYMGNIQQIDKQIYKTLQNSVNRDKQLLQRATSGLARGQRREEIAKILQQILTT